VSEARRGLLYRHTNPLARHLLGVLIDQYRESAVEVIVANDGRRFLPWPQWAHRCAIFELPAHIFQPFSFRHPFMPHAVALSTEAKIQTDAVPKKAVLATKDHKELSAIGNVPLRSM
jgi:hypothetical protein